MRAKLPGSTYQVVLAVIDHTIGYMRENAGISLSRFQEKTKLSRWGVVKAIHDAERRNIIKVERENTSAKVPATYELKTDYRQWVTSQRRLPGTSQRQLHSMPVNASCPDQSTTVAQTSQHLTPATPTESNLKETLKKPIPPNIYNKQVPGEKAEATNNIYSSCLRENYVSPEGVTPSFPGENNATSTRRALVTEYLGLHGQSRSKDIALFLGITPLQMGLFFSQHKRHFRSIRRGVWALRG